MEDALIDAVARETHLTRDQVAALFEQFDRGVTVPYLVHYRKDLVGSLGYAGLRELLERRRELRKLDKRKREVIKKLKERELLTDELRDAIEAATSIRLVNDIFLPYRPKKQSRAMEAIALGLEPMARALLTQEDLGGSLQEKAAAQVDAEKGLPDASSVLKGCAYIICDWIAEERTLREAERRILRQEGKLAVRPPSRGRGGRGGREFKDLLNYEEKLPAVHPHRLMQAVRGARSRALEMGILAPGAEMREAAADLYLDGGKEALGAVLGRHGDDPFAEPVYVPLNVGSDRSGDDSDDVYSLEFPEVPETEDVPGFLVRCVEWSLQNILVPVLARELERELADQAEQRAMGLVRRNLRTVLMQRPIDPARVLAVAPGYRTGCKLVAMDEKGNPLEYQIVYPHTPKNELEEAKAALKALVEKHNLEVAAIGDGTACRETEALVSDMIRESIPNLSYLVVSETGLQSYVGSKLAKQELPGLPQLIKGAITLGRRVVDPLKELVKLDPKVLCSGPHMQLVSAKKLKDTLAEVVEECVCEVGVELNETELNQLRNVAGLNGNRARSILGKREQLGRFTARTQLREAEGIDETVFQQCAGFLRVSDAPEFFDRTRIHPENYETAVAVCGELGVDRAKLEDAGERAKIEEQRKQVNLTALESKCGAHYLVIRDIIQELASPAADPRMEEPAPALRKTQLKLENINVGDVLQGAVRNIVDFGVFVDVGVNEDGLIHVSELSDDYVHSPYEVLSTGDAVTVRVIKVDLDSGRIALSMRKEGSRPSRSRPPRRSPSDTSRGERPAAATAPTVAGPGRPARPATARTSRPRPAASTTPSQPHKIAPVQVPQSTLGAMSRRVQKASLDTPLSKTEKRILQSMKAEAARKKDGSTAEEGADEKEKGVTGLLGNLQIGQVEVRGEEKKE
jgi:uncharacterized protein